MEDWFLKYFGWFVLFLIGGMFGLFIWAFNSCEAEQNALVRQCTQDGRRYYECVAMFQSRCYGGGHANVYPSVIVH